MQNTPDLVGMVRASLGKLSSVVVIASLFAAYLQVVSVACEKQQSETVVVCLTIAFCVAIPQISKMEAVRKTTTRRKVGTRTSKRLR